MKSTFTVNEVPPQAIFNLPLFESYLVIDVRSQEAFNANAIASSQFFSIPVTQDADPVAESESEQRRESALQESFAIMINEYGGPERWNVCVIVTDSTSDSQFRAEWLIKKLKKLKQATPSPPSTPPRSRSTSPPRFRAEYSPVQSAFKSLINGLQEVMVIAGGFENFQRTFPFLCGPEGIPLTPIRPMPFQINDNILLGARSVELDRRLLAELSLTHMIVEKGVTEVLPVEVLTSGVQILECMVPDSPAANLRECWHASSMFIDECIAKGGRVLVQLWGRSLSAGLVAAWFILSRGMDAEVAANIVRQTTRNIIDDRLISMTQLKKLQAWRSHFLPAPDGSMRTPSPEAEPDIPFTRQDLLLLENGEAM